MKSIGIVRAVDQLGRVVLPKELRRTLCIGENSPLEVFVEDDGKIILKKYQPACIFCDNATDVRLYREKIVCKDCINNLDRYSREKEKIKSASNS